MIIATAIEKNIKIKNRKPITLEELTSFVNTYFLKTPKSSTAVRNILISKDDYYNFNYFTINRGIFGPKELDNSKKLIKKIANKRFYKEAKETLSYSLGLSNQNVSIETWYIFGKETKNDLNFLKCYKQHIECEFIKILDHKKIKIFMFLMDIKEIWRNSSFLKKYIRKNNITIDYIIKSCNVLKQELFKENDWSRFTNCYEEIKSTLMEAILYAKK